MFRPRKGKIEERTSSFEVQKQVTFDKLLQTNPRLDFFSLSIQLRKFVFDGFLSKISNEMFIFFSSCLILFFFRFSTLIAHDRSDSEDPIARFVCVRVFMKRKFSSIQLLAGHLILRFSGLSSARYSTIKMAVKIGAIIMKTSIN